MKTPTEEPRDKDTILALLQATDRVRRSLSAVLRQRDLTLQQYNVLRILRGAAPEALPTLEIAERMIEKTPGASRLVDRLEAQGLVHRERCPEDRRQVLCTLTERAREILAELDEPITRADAECLAQLSDREKHQLRDLASRVAS
ncbi:MAG: MarR family transcriptional regulator [Acidobacteria bacterium]|nr:MarR family transcriptional regulator [Acidobacteriota bacterium]